MSPSTAEPSKQCANCFLIHVKDEGLAQGRGKKIISQKRQGKFKVLIENETRERESESESE